MLWENDLEIYLGKPIWQAYLGSLFGQAYLGTVNVDVSTDETAAKAG